MSAGGGHTPRLEALLRARGVETMEALVAARLGFERPRLDDYLVKSLLRTLPADAPDERVEAVLVEAAVVGETFFLRHAGQLQWLKSGWLGAAAAGAAGRPLQILFAGCSTGEEVWSFFGSLGPAIRAAHPAGFRVLAVDVSARALAVARARRYRTWSLRGVDLQANPWLRPTPDGAVEIPHD